MYMYQRAAKIKILLVPPPRLDLSDRDGAFLILFAPQHLILRALP